VPEPSFSQVLIPTEKLSRYKLPGNAQIPAVLTSAKVKCYVQKSPYLLINSIQNKEH
jgi:hypothetical protein